MTDQLGKDQHAKSRQDQERGSQRSDARSNDTDRNLDSGIVRLDPGPRMSQAVVHSGTVYLAGQVGTAGMSAAEQTATILANIDSLLARCGSSKAHILSAAIWLADMADFQAFNTVWEAWVDENHPPARSTCEAKLAHPGYLVEITIAAAVGREGAP